jgi:hypothetical protein
VFSKACLRAWQRRTPHGNETDFLFPSMRARGRKPLCSYVDVVFTEPRLNDRAENLLLLASCLANAIEGCEKWWADVSFVLQRNKALVGASMPWGLMLQMKNYGRSEEEARKFWGVTLSQLGKAIALLPRDFRLVE